MLASKNRLCIDIGNNRIKITEAAVSKNGINIKKAAILETPDNSFNDGDITNLISMKDEIERGLKENKIKCKNAVFTVNSTNIITREFTIPMTKEENIRGIISSEMEQYLPLSYESYVLEYLNLGKVEEGLKIRVIVFPKDVAKNYFDLCNNLKLKPLALDINSNGTTKIMERVEMINGSTVSGKKILMIDLGDNSITFNGYNDRQLKFSRVMEAGLKDVYKYFVEDRGNTKESVLERIQNIDLENSVVEELDQDSMIIYDTVLQWGRDIDRLFNYYTNSLKEGAETLYIYGGGSRIKGIDRIFNNLLEIKVEKIEELKFRGNMLSDKNIDMLMNNIGASFRKGR